VKSKPQGELFVNILVCVKQVPDTTEIKIDPVTNTLIRAGVPSIVNPFDGYALELAVRLKEKHGGTITVLSMGPEQAKEALRSCLSVGADQAFLVSDRIFGGSDTLATSYILSSALQFLEKKLGVFDIIFCGKQAIAAIPVKLDRKLPSISI
jgi:electron transfer flavoprotein beta subunit